MTDLLQLAARTLDTAQACSAVGSEGEWTVLADLDGGWRMVAGADREPGPLALSRGAQRVLRVRRRGGAVQVEAWESGRRCVLEARAVGQALQSVVPEVRLYAAALV
ncbi:MAG: hypothetical protein ACUVS7_08340 [Bryobacteraceae bacterium]